MRTIPLTQGRCALVDDADFEFLTRWKWLATRRGRSWYAERTRRKSDPPGPRLIVMHRVLLCPARGFEADHINGNGLDNRRANLRLATRGVNQANRIHQQRRMRGCPMGVTPRGKRFEAGIRINRRQHYLGTFDTPAEAHAAYMAVRECRIAKELANMETV